VIINGRVPDTFKLRAGERVRLRLINVANARVFNLKFEGHKPTVIALDGQPVTPHRAPGGRVTLGAAMRADIVLDASGKPGESFRVVDDDYTDNAYRVVDLSYSDQAPLRESPLDAPVALAANTMPEPDLGNAEKHYIKLEGGMMGSLRSAMFDGRTVDMREMMHNGKAWTINGVVATGPVMEPMLTLERGRSYILDLRNHTRFGHPMHIHGHSFRVITRNGLPTTHREWLDTVLLERGEAAEVAFVADNPGDWMFHCHILEHQMGGMMGIVRVI
jgi:FtsP/CotA-like multicopper oxidase with cupredoxin domain